MSSRLASYEALSTTMGLEDLHDLLEINTIDAHNRRVIAARGD